MALNSGMRVRVHGLSASTELNGIEGTLEQYIEEMGRWVLVLDSGRAVRVRPEKVTRVFSVDYSKWNQLDSGSSDGEMPITKRSEPAASIRSATIAAPPPASPPVENGRQSLLAQSDATRKAKKKKKSKGRTPRPSEIALDAKAVTRSQTAADALMEEDAARTPVKDAAKQTPARNQAPPSPPPRPALMPRSASPLHMVRSLMGTEDEATDIEPHDASSEGSADGNDGPNNDTKRANAVEASIDSYDRLAMRGTGAPDSEMPVRNSDDQPFTLVVKRRTLRSTKEERCEARAHERGRNVELEQVNRELTAILTNQEAELAAMRSESKQLKCDLGLAVHQLEMARNHSCETAREADAVITSLWQELGQARQREAASTAAFDGLLQALERTKSRVLEMLHGQLAYYMKGHYMKLDPCTLSIESVLTNGYAARNIIEFYRLLDPMCSERGVLEILSATYDQTVLLDDHGIHLISCVSNSFIDSLHGCA